MATQGTVRPREVSKAMSLIKTPDYRFMASLIERWRDESKYEDFADYEKAMRKQFAGRLKVTKATKRPFGFIFQAGSFAIQTRWAIQGARIQLRHRWTDKPNPNFSKPW